MDLVRETIEQYENRFALNHLRDLISIKDEQNQIMTTNVQVTLKWQDEHLRWSPSYYKNQTRTVFSAREIWTPDIVLFNSADVAYSQQREHYLLSVHSNGTVEWVFPDVFRSYCDVMITYFPFGSFVSLSHQDKILNSFFVCL